MNSVQDVQCSVEPFRHRHPPPQSPHPGSHTLAAIVQHYHITLDNAIRGPFKFCNLYWTIHLDIMTQNIGTIGQRILVGSYSSSCIRVASYYCILYQGCQTGLTAHLMSTCASQENNEKADLQTDFLKGNRRLTKIKIMTSSYCSLGGEVQFQGRFVTDIFNNWWIITGQFFSTPINVIDIVIY